MSTPDIHPVAKQSTLQKRALWCILSLASLLMVGVGAEMMSPGCGLLLTGLLLWLDLSLWSMRRK